MRLASLVARHFQPFVRRIETGLGAEARDQAGQFTAGHGGHVARKGHGDRTFKPGEGGQGAAAFHAELQIEKIGGQFGIATRHANRRARGKGVHRRCAGAGDGFFEQAFAYIRSGGCNAPGEGGAEDKGGQQFDKTHESGSSFA